MLFKNLLSKIVLIIDKTNSAVTACTMWLIIPLIFVMLYEVVMRYVFHKPSLWGADMSIMIFGAYMVYAGPCSVYEKVQVGVDIFSSRWSPRTQAIVSCLTYIFTAVFFIAVIRLTWIYGSESWQMKEISSSAWGQPIYHWKMLVPFAIGLTFLQTFAEFLRNLYHAVTGEDL